MDSNRGKSKKSGSTQRKNRRAEGGSQQYPTSIPETQIPNYQPYPSYQHQHQQIPVQHAYNQFHLPEDNSPGFNLFPQNPYSYSIPETPTPNYVPDTSQYRDTSQFRDAQDDESSSETPPIPQNDPSSDEIQPTPQTQTKPKRDYTKRLKRRPWTEREEAALAKAYISISEDDERGNHQRGESFWERVLEHFSLQVRGTDRTRHQLNSKWKELQAKINHFNCIYNNKSNSRASGKSDVDVLKSTHSEYRKLFKSKAFPHEAAWEILKAHAKWLTVKAMGDNSPPPSSKRTKTSDSNTYTTSSDAQFPSHLHEPHEEYDATNFPVEEPQPQQQRQRKGKKAASTTSQDSDIRNIVQQIDRLAATNESEAEEKKRYRAGKMKMMESSHHKKELILEQELKEMKERRFEKDLAFFLRPHDHLTGGMLEAMLARKRQLAEIHGWSF